ncbi:MAG: sugar phosphate isomerase/epimerase [Clostridia bacterium]|nr:sugar phosphate isomerase/epimerase [Clostridia bacterium]
MDNIRIFAFSDEASPDLDLQIEALKRNKLQGMEIRNVDNINVSVLPVYKAREIRKKLDDNGLRVWSIGSPIGKIGIDDVFANHMDTFKHTLEIAEILGAENMRLFSFYMPEGEDPQKYRGKAIGRMAQFVEAAQDYDITLCHENEKGIYGDNAERCLDIHQHLPEVKAIFDPANFVQSGVDTLHAWELLKPYVKYMHIKDAVADGSVVPAGYGVGNLPTIVSEFVAQGGREFTIEPHLTIFEGLRGLEREGERTKIRFEYPDSQTAFDVACDSFKRLLV